MSSKKGSRTMTIGQQKPCPFCRLFVGKELWEPIGNTFFGAPVSLAGERSCSYCKRVAEGHEEEVIADLYKWRAENGGTELHNFFGGIAWVMDYALVRLVELFGSLVELYAYLDGGDRSEMLLVNDASGNGFLVHLGDYAIWVEQVREVGWSGTTVINREDYAVLTEEAIS